MQVLDPKQSMPLGEGTFAGLSRRDWLQAVITLLALPEAVAAQQEAHQAAKSATPPAFKYLDRVTAREIDALASRILPSDGTPGAREAGVTFFIDRALVTFDKSKQGLYRDGMAAMQAKRRVLFPKSKHISELTESQQNELLRSMERTEFFQVLRSHTLAGFLGNPGYGGNRDRVGWKFIGFEGRMAYRPPFGFYDREAASPVGSKRKQ